MGAEVHEWVPEPKVTIRRSGFQLKHRPAPCVRGKKLTHGRVVVELSGKGDTRSRGGSTPDADD